MWQPAENDGPCVVALGGSDGGVPDYLARPLAERGFTTLALGYFAAPDRPRSLVELPLERVADDIDAFGRTYSAGSGVAVIGVSKGAELALLLAGHLGAAVTRTIAVAPSCVAWYGIAWHDYTAFSRPSWTCEDRRRPPAGHPVGR